jgi:hypothetical protein
MLLQANLKVYFEQLLSEESTRARLRDTLKKFGFDTTDWVRVVMYRRCFEFMGTLKPETLDVWKSPAARNGGARLSSVHTVKVITPTLISVPRHSIVNSISLLPIKFLNIFLGRIEPRRTFLQCCEAAVHLSSRRRFSYAFTILRSIAAGGPKRDYRTCFKMVAFQKATLKPTHGEIARASGLIWRNGEDTDGIVRFETNQTIP